MENGSKAIVGLAALAWLLGSGCTRPNLDYGQITETESGSEGDEGELSSTSTGSTDALPPADSTGDDPADSADSTGSAGSADPDGDDTGDVCQPQPPSPLVVEMFAANGLPTQPESATCGTARSFARGRLWVEGNVIHTSPCQTCGCEDAESAFHVELSGVQFPSTPWCGRLVLWSAPSDAGCVWTGMAVYSGFDDDVPVFVATNGRDIPDPPFFEGPEVELVARPECEGSDACESRPPGPYRLAVADQVIDVGESETIALPFPFPFPGVLSFEITNLMSSIDEACVEHVAWTAEQT